MNAFDWVIIILKQNRHWKSTFGNNMNLHNLAYDNHDLIIVITFSTIMIIDEGPS